VSWAGEGIPGGPQVVPPEQPADLQERPTTAALPSPWAWPPGQCPVSDPVHSPGHTDNIQLRKLPDCCEYCIG